MRKTPMNQSVENYDPQISVVMSCFNASRWLCEAIESVINQTFSDFEFIIVDDGSTDDTGDIIQKYRSLDDRIVAISKHNTGLADSLNVGIAQARGRLIARLDADDLCEPTRLAEQLEYMCAHPDVVLLGSGFTEIDENGHFIKKQHFPKDHRRLVRHLERTQRFFPHASAMFRRDAVLAVGCYNKLFRRAQDWDLWTRLVEHGKIACLRPCLVRIRKHPLQLSNFKQEVSQSVYGTAASICHFLRAQDGSDIPANSNEARWNDFLVWIESRMAQDGRTERRNAWSQARAEYFAGSNRFVGLSHFVLRLLKSGHACSLLWEKFFGSSLPKLLAKEWMGEPCGIL